MSLIQLLKVDQLDARKMGYTVTATTLTTLIGEAAMVGLNDGKRETTDDEVVAIIKKFIKGINETMDVTFDSGDAFEALKCEKALLEHYLPQQFTEGDLETIVTGMVAQLTSPSMKDMGKLMGSLKENFNGQYDGKMASGVVRRLLNA